MATRTPPKGRLGRGLGSLIPSAPERSPSQEAERGAFFECEIDRIDAMSGQPRTQFNEEALQELAASIRVNGIIQPLVVRAADDDRFRLIAGERRLRAARLAGLDRVPVVVRDTADDDDFALALIENIQRQDLDAIEEAHAYERLIAEHAFTQDELAQRLGRSRSAIANALRLLRLAPAIQSLVSDGQLSAGHARAVLSVPADEQGPLAERILTESLSVREAEHLARELRDGPAPPAPAPAAPAAPSRPSPPPPSLPPAPSPDHEQLTRALQREFGLKVDLYEKPDTSGSITFFFADREALNDFLDRIRKT